MQMALVADIQDLTESIPTLSILWPDSCHHCTVRELAPWAVTVVAPDLRCTDSLATHTDPICFILTSSQQA